VGEKEKMYSEFLEVSKQTGVPVKKVLDVFWYLSRDEVVENNELVKRVGVSRNALNQVKKALSAYLIPSSRETSIKKGMIERVGGLYDTDYVVEESLLSILMKRDAYRQSVELLSSYKADRPSPRRDYDQFTATLPLRQRQKELLCLIF